MCSVSVLTLQADVWLRCQSGSSSLDERPGSVLGGRGGRFAGSLRTQGNCIVSRCSLSQLREAHSYTPQRGWPQRGSKVLELYSHICFGHQTCLNRFPDKNLIRIGLFYGQLVTILIFKESHCEVRVIDILNTQPYKCNGLPNTQTKSMFKVLKITLFLSNNSIDPVDRLYNRAQS